MFKVAVINFKNLIKIVLKIIIALIIIAMIFNFSMKKSFCFETAYIGIISNNLSLSTIYEEENESLEIEKILSDELSIFSQLEGKNIVLRK